MHLILQAYDIFVLSGPFRTRKDPDHKRISIEFYLHDFSWQLLNMSEDRMEDGFTIPPEPVTEDGDMPRLMLQHCVMPAYQFIIQVAPDQTSVNHPTFLCLVLCLVLWGTVVGKIMKLRNPVGAFIPYIFNTILKGLSFELIFFYSYCFSFSSSWFMNGIHKLCIFCLFGALDRQSQFKISCNQMM